MTAVGRGRSISTGRSPQTYLTMPVFNLEYVSRSPPPSVTDTCLSLLCCPFVKLIVCLCCLHGAGPG